MQAGVASVKFVNGMKQRRAGIIWIVLSATGFGLMPLFGRTAYADGVSVSTLLCLRFLVAGSLMCCYALYYHRGRKVHLPEGKALYLLGGMGALGYAGQSFCYFGALKYASAGLTALLLYLNPIIVTVLSAWLTRRHLTRRRLLAVLMAFMGTALAVGGEAHGSWQGIMLGLGAAGIYSVYILVGELVMKREDPLVSASIVMLSAGLVYLCILCVSGANLPSSLSAWCAIFGVAFFSTFLAILGFLIGMRALGAPDAATLSTLEPVVTIVTAAIFLNEGIGAWQITGGVLILAAVIVLVRFANRGVGS